MAIKPITEEDLREFARSEREQRMPRLHESESLPHQMSTWAEGIAFLDSHLYGSDHKGWEQENLFGKWGHPVGGLDRDHVGADPEEAFMRLARYTVHTMKARLFPDGFPSERE